MMLRTSLAACALAAASLSLTTACHPEELSAQPDTETAAFTTTALLADTDNHGGHGMLRALGECYAIVFPISLAFPDGSSTEVADRDAAKAAIQTWRKAQPDRQRGHRDRIRNRPVPVYPISLLDATGNTVEVADAEVMRTLVRECVGKRDRVQGERCFTLVFPVDVMLPDNSTQTVVDKEAFAQLRRAQQETSENGSRRGGRRRGSSAGSKHLKLVYPVDITLADGSVEQLNSQEALRELRKACKD